MLGAGPAGCAAALRARKAGMRVLIVDISSGPKNSPGETLHPGIEPLLQQLGVADKFLQANFKRHAGIWIDTHGAKHFSAYGEDQYGPWQGFQADRKILGALLQQAVMDAGATLLRKTRPNELLINDNSVVGALIDNQIIHATWTIDATGRNAWLAQELKLVTEIHSPPLYVKFGWLNQQPPELHGQPLFTFHSNGWRWQAPVNANRTAWVELHIGKADESPPGMNLSWQLRPECAGPGFILLGDTAATLDPSSSHGVLRALMSGILAGHLLENEHAGRLSQTQVIESYREWIHTQFRHEKNKLMQFYIDSPAGLQFMAGMKAI